MVQKASTATSMYLPEIFSLEIEHLLSLPCHVYWKDRKSIYLGYNNYGAQRLGFDQGGEITGHSDFEIFPQLIATEFIKNDQTAMTQKKQVFVHEDAVLKDGLNVVFFSYKIPLFDHDESVIGLLGLSFTRAPENRCPSAQLERDFNYYPSSQQQPLSKMENACIHHLCLGLTTKQIARRLKLSPKTVETYIERAKTKFGCRNKAQLMWAMVNKFN